MCVCTYMYVRVREPECEPRVPRLRACRGRADWHRSTAVNVVSGTRGKEIQRQRIAVATYRVLRTWRTRPSYRRTQPSDFASSSLPCFAFRERGRLGAVSPNRPRAQRFFYPRVEGPSAYSRRGEESREPGEEQPHQRVVQIDVHGDTCSYRRARLVAIIGLPVGLPTGAGCFYFREIQLEDSPATVRYMSRGQRSSAIR